MRRSRSRRFGSAPRWSPAVLPGVVAWYRSDLGITLNGGNVSAWADQSGFGRHLVQATAGLQPPWTAASANYGGRPLVSAPAGQWMAVDLGADQNQPNTLLLAGLVNNRLVDGSTIDGKRNTCMASGGFVSMFAGAAVISSTQASGARLSIECYFAGSNSEMRVAGGANILPGNPGALALRSLGIFATADGVGTGVGDELAELVILNRQVTAAERNAWAAYTLRRYGL